MLMAAETLGIFAGYAADVGMVASDVLDGLRAKKPPRNFFESLIRDDWRDWIGSVRKEMKGWDDNGAYEVIDFEEASREHPVLELVELLSIKRDGRYKMRLIALGNALRQGLDYKDTFAPTVSGDGLWWLLSLACAANKKIRGGDISTAYLTGEQRSDLAAFIPSFGELWRMDWTELERLRMELLELEAKEGTSAVKELGQRRGKPEKLWKIKRPIYGIPDAGNAFAEKNQTDHRDKLKFEQSTIDPCIY
jgi:hypothetical protein